ncbi:MAG: phosphoribosylaminoimidazolesuccinocarboxamide synthase [Calditrichaeota bacterium]|nr:phosphoribosylaminoimidazolesuccinocarboxamide synthase [Calditrichota bacterium]
MRGELFIKGKNKCLYRTSNEQVLALEFKNEQSEYDGEKRVKFKQKAELRKEICKAIFEYLESYRVFTHYLRENGSDELLVKKLKMFDFSVQVRNVAAGLFCRRFNTEEGKTLSYPVIEYYLKDQQLNEPMMTETHVFALGLATPDELRLINRLASKVNVVLKAMFERRGMLLADLRLEFGKHGTQVMVGDEISPETFRVRFLEQEDGRGKNRLDFTNSNAAEAYQFVLQKVKGR